MDHDTGYCKLTVSCFGAIGHDVPGFDAGIGFCYPKTATSALYFASLAIGNDPNYVVDHYYSCPANSGPNNDFTATESLSAVIPPGLADEHFRGVFTDAGHGSPKGLSVTQNSYMTAAEGYNDFIVLNYNITNTSSNAINGTYAGVFADFDVGSNPALNFCYSDTVGRSMKMWMQGTQNPTVGLKILYPKSFRNLTAVDHVVWVYPDTCVTDNQKFRFLNGSIVLRRSNRAYDWSIAASVGPFDLAPGGAQKFAVAVVGAADTTTFKANAESAQSWYDREVALAEGPKVQTPVLRLGAVPNPFSEATTIRYSASAPGRLEVEAYDATGRLVDRLVAEVKVGDGAVNWRPKNLGAGLYFLKVKTPGHESVFKALRTD
jgi:serine protease